MKTSADRLKWFLDFAQLDWVSDVDPEEFMFGTPESITGLKELKEWEYLKLKEEVIEFIGGTDPNEPVQFGIEEKPIEWDDDYPIYANSDHTLRDQISEWLTREELAALCVRSRGSLPIYYGP